jgi:hypothetical protein
VEIFIGATSKAAGWKSRNSQFIIRTMIKSQNPVFSPVDHRADERLDGMADVTPRPLDHQAHEQVANSQCFHQLIIRLMSKSWKCLQS